MSVRLTFGLVLLALGVLFLLDALDVAEAGPIIGSWWPLVLVVLGALLAVEQRRLGLGPALFIGLGIVLLVVTTDIVPFGFNIVWPLVLIVAGVWLVLRRSPLSPGAGDATGDSRLDVTAVFGDRRVRSVSERFEAAVVTTVFGDVDIDLSDAKPAGDAPTVDLSVIFGDVDVTAPPGWKTTVTASSVFGDITQRGADQPPAEHAPTLAVRGFVLFGDVKIRQG